MSKLLTKSFSLPRTSFYQTLQLSVVTELLYLEIYMYLSMTQSFPLSNFVALQQKFLMI